MDIFSRLEQIVELYFSKKYNLYKSEDAKGEVISKWFNFESRSAFLDAYLQYYKNLPNLKSAIIDACSSKFKILYEGEEYEIKHTHQEEFKDEEGNIRGVNNAILTDMASKLVLKEDEISNAKCFDDVMKIIRNTKVIGFGDLSIYDASVRISAYLGLVPDKVYLHAGTKEGAKYLEDKKLLPEGASDKIMLPMDDFPEPIQKLNPLQVENFLCSFKLDLKKI